MIRGEGKGLDMIHLSFLWYECVLGKSLTWLKQSDPC